MFEIMPRHVSTHFAELNFALSKMNGSYVALCLVCGRYLKNTAAKRILAHRNICKEEDANATKSGNVETVTLPENPSSSVINHSVFDTGETMRSRGNVWNFFNFDKDTKRVTCKYCDKQYKRNATRMQEHLNTCAPFQASDEKTDFEIKHRSKEPGNVQIVEDLEAENSSNETINFDSDLIRVEHKYNSVIPTIRSEVPIIKRRYSEKSHFNYTSCVNECSSRRDEFDIFGEHVANELRKIQQNALLLANTKLKLSEILHKAVIESLQSENHVSIDCSS